MKIYGRNHIKTTYRQETHQRMRLKVLKSMEITVTKNEYKQVLGTVLGILEERRDDYILLPHMV